MELTMNIAPKGISAIPYVAEQIQRVDKEVPTVKPVATATTLPPDRIFVAQVVAARLSGTAFPESPGEIAPPERTLKPYDVPMLPYEKDAPSMPEAQITPPGDVAVKGQDTSSTTQTDALKQDVLPDLTEALSALPGRET